ncbi:flagellin [Methylobacterium aquaticum]|uniref:flagellin N-terminal helical domain-containing protein n=1 Tax=Methylobacterium aquaticum TaxID=270351 RepID=UPI001932741F|nr:flagellin [Methylobacterium aquaticum]QRE72641.1 flagellin [Methylobacterium aquaticum]
MTSLLTNNAAMTALTTLKNINQSLDTTSNRVSTGQRVSAASDNAAYWSIATTVRTDNASLGAVKDSLGLGSSSVDTAYNGLNSILSDLQNMRAKLQTALTPGVDRTKVQVEIAAIQSKMKATADSSNSSGQNWLSVNSATSNTAYQATQSVVGGFARAANGNITFSQIGVNVQSIKLYDTNSTSVNTAATSAQFTATTALTGTAGFRPGAAAGTAGTADFSGNNEVSFSLAVADGTSTTAGIVINKAALQSAAKDLTKVTTDEFLSAINNQITASAIGANRVQASLDTSGRLTFQTVATGSAVTLSLTNVTASTGKTLIDVGFSTTVPSSGSNANGVGTAAGTTMAQGILDTANNTYTNTGGGSYSIANFNISTLVGTNGDLDLGLIISAVDKAIGKVTDAGTKLGANKTQIDGQKTFVDTLMKANDRTIGILVDADVEEESTKLKALQTQQQLAVQALSIANSASQNVLSLFR